MYYIFQLEKEEKGGGGGGGESFFVSFLSFVVCGEGLKETEEEEEEEEEQSSQQEKEMCGILRKPVGWREETLRLFCPSRTTAYLTQKIKLQFLKLFFSRIPHRT